MIKHEFIVIDKLVHLVFCFDLVLSQAPNVLPNTVIREVFEPVDTSGISRKFQLFLVRKLIDSTVYPIINERPAVCQVKFEMV